MVKWSSIEHTVSNLTGHLAPSTYQQRQWFASTLPSVTTDQNNGCTDETYTLTVYGTAECEMTMKAIGLIVPLLISFPAAKGLTYPLALLAVMSTIFKNSPENTNLSLHFQCSLLTSHDADPPHLALWGSVIVQSLATQLLICSMMQLHVKYIDNAHAHSKCNCLVHIILQHQQTIMTLYKNACKNTRHRMNMIIHSYTSNSPQWTMPVVTKQEDFSSAQQQSWFSLHPAKNEHNNTFV